LNYLRQLEIVSQEQLRMPVHIIGCGGIGSPTSLALGKMGCQHLTLYDDDRVSDHNLPNQFYRHHDIGRFKVEALKDILAEYTEAQVETVCKRIDRGEFAGIVIFAVDSMSARRQIWESSVRFRQKIALFVDARMGAEVCRIYSIVPFDPDDVRFYESTLYSDAEADPEPCTQRAIIYNTLSIASLISNQVKKFARTETLRRELAFDLKTLTLIAC
jgi:molybdopterin/thiamine biosynthesis adenylyltransferase